MTPETQSETQSPGGNEDADAASKTTGIEATIYKAVCQSILDVAPDLDSADLETSTNLHDDLGLDSIDLVNVAKAIGDRVGFEISDKDYARLHRIGEIVDFVVERSDPKL